LKILPEARLKSLFQKIKLLQKNILRIKKIFVNYKKVGFRVDMGGGKTN
jgi:hypothetical protein